MQIVVTMAGKSSRFKKYGFEKPKFLIEIFGKTLFEYSLESLPLDRTDKIVFVVLEEHYKKYNLEKFISDKVLAVNDALYVDIVCIKETTRGQSETAYLAKDNLQFDKPLIIYNIDTYFKYDFSRIINKTGTFTNPEDNGVILGVKQEGEQWSFAETDSNGKVKRTAEKERISDNALVGFYLFEEACQFFEAYLKQEAENKKINGEFYVAPLYNYLIEDEYNIFFDTVGEFIPLGTPQEIFSFIRSKKKPTKPRSFNEIKIDKQKQTLLKGSSDTQKLFKECNWYRDVVKQNEISQYVPKMLNYKRIVDWSIMEMEYVPHPSLSEIFLYENLTEHEINECLNKLFFVWFELHNAKPDHISPQRRINLLENKTFERILQLRTISFFRRLTTENGIWLDMNVNGVDKNFKVFFNGVVDYLLKQKPLYGIFHGDLCFPNILCDKDSWSMKLIDPRGDYHNDTYYDLAKIRHSLSGYDLIVNGFYNLDWENDVVKYDIFWNNNFNKKTLTGFDDRVIKMGLNLDYIKMIEAVLFLTMIPLHTEDEQRQKMFFILALEKFDQL